MTSVIGSLVAVVLGMSPAFQGAAPTVGDTIWVRRSIRVPAGHTVRAADWEPSDPVQLLGRAHITITGDSAAIAYPLVLWRPGRHVVGVPGPLVLGPGGTVDSLGGERVTLDVASVLPAAPRDSALSPQPKAGLIERRVVSPVPLFVLWLVALALLLPGNLWWRRRGRPVRPARVEIAADALEAPLARWADAGEYRAVANAATAQIRSALAERVPAAHASLDTERVLAELAAARPGWPLEDVGNLLRSLDDVRFGVTPSSEALGLSRSSIELRERILRDAA
jgi:hypothetical protein